MWNGEARRFCQGADGRLYMHISCFGYLETEWVYKTPVLAGH